MPKVLVLALVLPLIASLYGCITLATQKALDDQRNLIVQLDSRVAKLQVDLLAAEASGSQDTSAIKAALLEAQRELAGAKGQLVTIQEQAAKERAISAAGTGEVIANSSAPIASLFLPVVGMILSALGYGLGQVKQKIQGTIPVAVGGGGGGGT